MAVVNPYDSYKKDMEQMVQEHYDGVDDKFSQFTKADVQNLSPEIRQATATNRQNSDYPGGNNYVTGSHNFTEGERIKQGYYGGVNGDKYIPINGSTQYISPWDASNFSPSMVQKEREDKAKGEAGYLDQPSLHTFYETERAKHGYSGGADGSQYIVLKNSDGTDRFTYGSAPEFVSRYDDTINSLANQIMGRDKFSYNAADDPLYQNYAEQYTRNGSRAMQDTLAQISARTGGLASSYAGTAAQQTYGNYMQALNDKIPELYQLAYNMYQDEGNNLRNNLEMMRGLESDDFNKYGVRLNQYNNDLAFDYGNYRDNQNYEQMLKEMAMNKDQFDRNYNLSVAQAKSNQSMDAASLAASMIQAGYSPSLISNYLASLPNFNDGSGGGNNVNNTANNGMVTLMSSDYTPTQVTPTQSYVPSYTQANKSNVDLSSSTPISSANTETPPVMPTGGGTLNTGTPVTGGGTSLASNNLLYDVKDLFSSGGVGSTNVNGLAGAGSTGGGLIGNGSGLITGTAGLSTSIGAPRRTSRRGGSSSSGGGGYSSSSASAVTTGSGSATSSASSYSGVSSNGTLPDGTKLPRGKNIQWIDMLRASTGYTDQGIQKTMRISSIVGPRNISVPGASKNHKGTDITMPANTPVQVLAAGTVLRSGWVGGYGNLVEIQGDDGYVYKYAHNNKLLVKPGDRVEYGDTVSLSGSTGVSGGPHLHFEIRDANGNALDGRQWIDAYTPIPEWADELPNHVLRNYDPEKFKAFVATAPERHKAEAVKKLQGLRDDIAKKSAGKRKTPKTKQEDVSHNTGKNKKKGSKTISKTKSSILKLKSKAKQKQRRNELKQSKKK